MYHKIKRAAFDIRNVGSVDQQYDDYYAKCMQLATTSGELDGLVKDFLRQTESFLGSAVELSELFRPALDSFSDNFEFPPEPALKPVSKRAKSYNLAFSPSAAKQEGGFLVTVGPVSAATPEQLEAATLAAQSWASLASLGTLLTCSMKDSTLLLLQDFDTAVTALTNRKQERDNIRLQYDYYFHKTQKIEKHNASHPEKPLPPELVVRNKAKLDENQEMYFITNETLKVKMELIWSERLKHLGGIMDSYSTAQEMFFSTMSDSLQIMELDIPLLKEQKVQLKSEELGALLRKKELKQKGVWARFKTGVQLFNVNKASMQSDAVFTHQVAALNEYALFVAALQKQTAMIVTQLEQTMKTSSQVYRTCLIFHNQSPAGSPAKTAALRTATLHTGWQALCDTFKQRMESLSVGRLEEIKHIISILRARIKERDELANVYEYWKAKVDKDLKDQNVDPSKAADRIAKKDQALATFEAFNQSLKSTELGPFLQCRCSDVSSILAGMLRVQMWVFQGIRDIFMTHAGETAAANAAAAAANTVTNGAGSEGPRPSAPSQFFSPNRSVSIAPAFGLKTADGSILPAGTASPLQFVTESKTGGTSSALNTIEAYVTAYRRETVAVGAKALQAVADQQAQRQARAGEEGLPPAEVIRKRTMAPQKIVFTAGQTELNLMDTNTFRGLSADAKAVKYKELCGNLARQPSIRAIDLTNSDVGDDFAIELSKLLKHNSTIEEVNLNSNPLSDVGVQALCGALMVNSTLKVLKLHNLGVSLSKETQACMLNALKTNQSLVKLMYAFPQRHDEMLKDEYLDRNMTPSTRPPASSTASSETEDVICQHCLQATNPKEEFCGNCHVSREDPYAIFTILQRIGTGSFGAVYKAMDTRTSQIVAVKVLDVQSQTLASEISILRQCDSDYIVRYIGDYQTPSAYWIVMEYCGVGSVRDIIEICNRTLDEDEIAVVMKYTLYALEYFHKNNKIHRDIKAGNILITHSGDCKLSDFGVSAELSSANARRNTMIGTPYWMAPEVIQAFDYDSSADIWALGITAIELAMGDPPLHELEPTKVIYMIPSVAPPLLPESFNGSPQFNNFLMVCLQKDGSKRPSASELLSHPFIANARGKGVIQELVAECMPVIDASREQPPDEQGEVSPEQEPVYREEESKSMYATQQQFQVNAVQTPRDSEANSEKSHDPNTKPKKGFFGTNL